MAKMRITCSVSLYQSSILRNFSLIMKNYKLIATVVDWGITPTRYYSWYPCPLEHNFWMHSHRDKICSTLLALNNGSFKDRTEGVSWKTHAQFNVFGVMFLPLPWGRHTSVNPHVPGRGWRATWSQAYLIQDTKWVKLSSPVQFSQTRSDKLTANQCTDS